MIEQRFPKGWDEQRVTQLIAELDARTDEEWIAADEAAAKDGGPGRHHCTCHSLAGDSAIDRIAQDRLTDHSASASLEYSVNFPAAPLT